MNSLPSERQKKLKMLLHTKQEVTSVLLSVLSKQYVCSLCVKQLAVNIDLFWAQTQAISLMTV